MSEFAKAIAGADTVLRGVAGTAVSYHRGDSMVAITAVPASRDYEVVSDYGAMATWSSVDWLLPVADLVLDGARVVPEPGDRISMDVTGVGTRTWEIMHIPGQGHMSDADVSGTRVRVHAKLIGES
jgi:hypothetical protein